MRRILILGGSRYYSELLGEARKVCDEIVVLDGNPGSFCADVADRFEVVDIKDEAAVLDAAMRWKPDALIPVNDFGVIPAAKAARRLGLVGNPPEAAVLATNKALQKREWQLAGVPVADFREVRTEQEAARAVREMGRLPLVVKPSDSRAGGSRGVSKIHSPDELPRAFAFARTWFPESSVLVEQCLEGTEYSAELIVHRGRPYLLAVGDKDKTPEPWRVDKSVLYPSIFTSGDLDAIEDVACRAVRALGIENGGAQVEMVTTASGPHVFEIGARCGGGGTAHPITTHVSGVSMFEQVARIHLGEAPAETAPRFARGCVYRFLTPEPGIFAGVDGLEEIRSWAGVLDAGVTRAPGDEIRPVHTGPDRSGFIITGAETRAEAVALADRAEAALTFRYRAEEAAHA